MFQDGIRVRGWFLAVPSLFHEELTIVQQSLSLGRPPTMSLKWVDCDLPAAEERTPEQIRKNSASSLSTLPVAHFHWPVASFQYSITREVIWPLMELMQSTSPSSYSSVLELDKKLRELSAAANIYEDEQFNASAAALEWNCILGANVRQAGE